KAKSRKCYRFLSKTELWADNGLAISLHINSRAVSAAPASANLCPHQPACLTANDQDQVTQFVIHVLRVSHGVGNFRPQELTIALAKAMHRHPRGAFAQA